MKKITTTDDFHLRTLLILEDDEFVREVLEEMLRGDGFRILIAEDGETGFQIMKDQQVDAVLCDIMMPVMTGLEFLEKLRADGDQTPVVFVTGHPVADNILQGLRLGATDFVEKPFETSNLKQIIYRALDIGFRMRRVVKQLNDVATLGAQAETDPEELERDRKMMALLRVSNNQAHKKRDK